MITLSIQGMTCDTCAAHVKTALESVPGVRSAEVSYASGRANVAEEGQVSTPDLVKAVTALGYRAWADAGSGGNGTPQKRPARTNKSSAAAGLHIAIIGSGGAAMAAAITAAEDELFPLVRRAVIEGTKATGAGTDWTQGAKIYWNDTTKVFTKTSAQGLFLVGVAQAAAATTDAVGAIALDGVAVTAVP